MYTITELLDGRWHCSVRIQDGTETWTKDTKKEAVASVISGARVLNGVNINSSFIEFEKQEPPPTRVIDETDFRLLEDIKRKAKIILDCNDYRLTYNLTKKECEMVQDIREGGENYARDDRLIYLIATIAYNKHNELNEEVGYRPFDAETQVDHACRIYQTRLTPEERKAAILKSSQMFSSLCVV